MQTSVSPARRAGVMVAALCLSACAATSSGGLTPGSSTVSDVEARLGRPAMAWKNDDGSRQLAFAQGPQGTQTFMVFIAPDGRLQRVVGVLNEPFFSQIQPGMTQEQVLRLLGPASTPPATFARTGTLTWSWLHCASPNLMQYFNVHFDAATGQVRATGQHPWMHGYLPGTPPCSPRNIDLS